MKHSAHWVLLGALATSGAWAEEAPATETPPSDEPRLDYQIGLALINSPTYSGSSSRETKLRPVWGVQYGRFRVATSRASLIERSGAQGGGLPGASVDLGGLDRWKFAAALRVDAGRSSSDDPLLAGLPDVRSTVRLRVLGSYALTNDSQASLSASTDVAGRRGGTLLNLDVGTGGNLPSWGEGWRWSAGGGLQAADATYMMSYHGIPQGSASSLPAYEPGAGLHSVRAGAGLVWRFAPHWRAGAALGASSLLGAAADSPLTAKRSGYNVTVGLVYIGRP